MSLLQKFYSKSNSILNGEWNKKNIIFYISSVLLAIQFLGICYINIFQADMHLGYDASSNLLNSAMMWEQKALLPDNYEYQTGLHLSVKTILTSLVYGLTGDICLAFGIINIIFTAIMMALVYSICNSMKVSDNSTLIFLNAMLTPYTGFGYNTANPLGYFPCMYQTASFYSMSIVQYLLVVRCLLYFSEENKGKIKVVMIILSFIIAFFSGFSSGFSSLVYLIAPLLLFILIRIIVNGDIKFAIDKSALFSYLLTFFTILGKFTNSLAISFNSKESSMELIPIKEFWNNLGNIFLGFADLLSAGNQYVQIVALSDKGIITLFYASVMLLFWIGLIFSVIKFVKQFNKSSKDSPVNNGFLFILCFCFVNLFMYAAIDSAYGGEIFESRYLIPFFIFGLFFLVYSLDILKKNVFRNILSFYVIIALTIGTVSSYNYLDKGKCDKFSELKNIVSLTDAKVIYGYNTDGSDMHIYARDMRAVDTKRIYKLISDSGVHHWGDYNYVDDVGDCTGSTILMIVPNEFENLPDYVKKKYSYLDSWNNFNLYYSVKNPFDYITGIEDDGYSVELPNSNGIGTSNLEINENGMFETNGSEGYCIFGPYLSIKEGKYRFTLNYNVKESKDNYSAGVFDIAVDSGQNIINTKPIDVNKNSVSIEVQFNSNENYEHRVWSYSDSIIEIESIEIEKIA